LLVPGVDLRHTIAASKKTAAHELQTFHNRDLGEPYSPAEGRLSGAAIAAAQTAGGDYLQSHWESGYSGDALVTMGVDTASARDLHVRVSVHTPDLSRKRALFIGRVHAWSRLAQMMDSYAVRMAAVDHLPDGRLAREFVQQFYGRAFFVYFLPSTSREPFIFDAEERRAAVNRTEAIDKTLDRIRLMQNQLPIDLPEDYVQHLRNAVRFHDVDDVGRRTVGYRSTGPIDYLMAEVYDDFALDLARAEVLSETISTVSYVAVDEVVDFQRSTLDDPYAEYEPGPLEEWANAWDAYDDELYGGWDNEAGYYA
jgi:hypothetical protein